MAIKGRRVQIQEKTGTDTLVNIYPDTVAEGVWYDENTSIKDKLDNEVEGLNSKIENLNTGVTGVKGEAETDYRTGQVNITKANIGLGKVENRGVDTTPTANSTNYVESGGVAAELSNVVAIAEGKTNTYVIKVENVDIAGADSNVSIVNERFKIPKTSSLEVKPDLNGGEAIVTIEGKILQPQDLKLGDIILVQEAEYYDWWARIIVPNIMVGFEPFEAEKVDLTAYATKTYADGVPTTNKYEFTDNSNGSKFGKTVVEGINDLYTSSHTNSSRIEIITERISNIEGGTTAVGKANQLTNARNISLSGDATGSGSFDGSKDITITTTIGDGKITTSKLADSGVTEGTYSAVNVNAKGIVTKGANYIEYGTSSNNTPSENLVVGGLFFSFISES